MRFPGFGFSSPGRSAPSFRLSCPLGEQRVVISLGDEGQLRLRSKAGEVLEAHDMGAVSWQACVLPTREHALRLRVAEGGSPQSPPAVRELLLRAKSKEQVQQAAQQLAEHARRGARSQDSELEPAALEARLLAAGVQCPVPSRSAATQPPRLLAEEPAEPDPRSLSFGSPVAEADVGAGSRRSSGAVGCQDAAGEGGMADSPDALLDELLSDWGSDEEVDDAWDGGSDMDGSRHPPAGNGGSRAGTPAGHAAERGDGGRAACSAPTSPVLPGLPLVARVAGASLADARRPSVSAPVSPTQEAAAAAEPQVPLQQPRLPVRLLSFSGRPTGSSVHSHIQRLEAAVAQLSTELAQSRSAAGSSSLAASPSKQPGLAAPTVAAEEHAGEQSKPSAAAAGPADRPPRAVPEPSHGSLAEQTGGHRGDSTVGGSGSSVQADALSRENALLLEQQAAMQAELVRMQGQLSAAAADNIRLASQAAAAVAQLAAAADAMREGQHREQGLRALLAAAVEQCTAVGRELAGLSASMEAKDGQCWELRSAVEALSEEKMMLTAALTTAQMQLKEATPAGFAAETAELRRQAEAARSEAAAARAEAAVAAGKAAEAARREAEAAGHMREAARCMEAAQEARAAGLAREQQLAAEVRSLRQQLAGRLPEGDPARALQARVGELEGANASLQQERATLLGQVQQLSAVGQELSSSCRQLEAGLQVAAKERDSSQVALAKAQAAHETERQRWEQQRQQLESSLAAAKERVAGAEQGHQAARAQAEQLQARLDGLRDEAQAAAQRATAREQELQSELRLLSAKAEAERKAAAERAEAAAAAAAAEAGRQHDTLRVQAAELAAVRKEAGALEAEKARLQDELRRVREERAAATRDLQLEAAAAKAQSAQLAQELHAAQSTAEERRRTAEESQRAAQQAHSQAAAAVAAHSSASQERKELQARLDRACVERDRAARERDAAELKYAALQQQCRLLEAVAHGQTILGSSASNGSGGSGLYKRGGCKESGYGGWGEVEGLLIKAHRG